MNNILLAFIFFVLLIPGLAGIFLPLPGLLYMFVLAFIFGLIDNFLHLQGWELGVLGGIAVFSIINDYLTGILGARYGGASRRSMLLGILGMIAGTLLLPPFGGLIGVFLGIMLAEIFLHGDQERAVKAATGGFIGSVIGMVITLVLAVAFLFLFIIFALK